MAQAHVIKGTVMVDAGGRVASTWGSVAFHISHQPDLDQAQAAYHAAILEELWPHRGPFAAVAAELHLAAKEI
ncbi:MAG: hypothetical protein ABFD92_02145 [Planctomycetaceae bacterium]|nr:hypothetical protein [Planctomycetaceae bacterium]